MIVNMPEYPGYSVSDAGFVLGKSGRVLSPKISNRGYEEVCLLVDGDRLMRSVHRLVAAHFVANPEKKPQVNHIDGNKTNNAACNLEWMTNQENFEHGVDVGLEAPKRSVTAVPKEPGVGYWFPSIREAAGHGFDRSHISTSLNGIPFALTHKGYYWI